MERFSPGQSAQRDAQAMQNPAEGRFNMLVEVQVYFFYEPIKYRFKGTEMQILVS